MTPRTTTFEFGDVVLVPFPFTDQVFKKRRPAVVVGTAAYNLARPDVILLAITASPGGASAYAEAPIVRWQAAGLIKPSVLKPIVATFETAGVVKRLGRLAGEDIVALRSVVRAIVET